MTQVVQPGSTIGVLGSGQLGRMFAIAARRMGYRVHVLSPDNDTPTGQVADLEIESPYDDLDQVEQFARQVDVVTFEFENVPSATTQAVERFARVRPSGELLHTTQNRLREKTFLQNAGFPVTPFRLVHDFEQLESAVDQLGLPAVLKSSHWGYDGKGQALLRSPNDLSDAWASIGPDEAVLEQFVEFESEMSVIGARSVGGQFVCFDPIANHHVNHILDLSVAPAGLPPKTDKDAMEIARELFEKLQVVGVLCIEFFVTRDGGLLINELAPRPHNSGHLTIDAHVTCQFEQQVRAVCGLPLGATTQLRPAAMVNLLGDLWNAGEPDWNAACSHPDVKLHLYGKQAPRPGRKMGHLTALASSAEIAARIAKQAREKLSPGLATCASSAGEPRPIPSPGS